MILVDINESQPCGYGEAIRALSDNRDRYIEQSRRTEAGKLGELPPSENWTDNISPLTAAD